MAHKTSDSDPSIRSDFDLLILGGGCAGLTLAVELIQRRYAGRILIVEPRQNYVRDRTWCYWGVAPHSFQECVTHRWNAWSVGTQRQAVRQTSELYAYEQISSECFYASALRTLATAPHVSLWHATRADAVRSTPDGFEVETTRGLVRGPMLFDARPPIRPDRPPMLTQHFLGWHVRTHDRTFDPSCVTLMDFWTPQGPDIAFCYVLPYSEHEALVEATFLTPDCVLDAKRRESSLRDYLERRLGIDRYEIRYREQGAIPMGLPLTPRSKLPTGYHPIGTRGGLVRPSTGYAFLAIQRWSQTAAEAIVAGRPESIPARPYSAVSGWLDGIFLQRLVDDPGATTETFRRLFEHSGADATVRFLSDRAGLSDYLDVISSLPTWPFLKTAMKRTFTRGATSYDCEVLNEPPASVTRDT